MLGNRAMIGKLSGFYISGSRSRVADMGSTTSPRGPLDLKVESPGGLKNYDLGGVGIGIVAALEKSSDAGREILAKYALCSASINRFCPKPVSSTISTRKHSSGLKDELEEFDSSEDYTYVTCHGHKNSTTKVYYDGGCPPPDSLARQHRDGFEKFSHLGQFKNSQNRCTGHSEYPVSDSLSSCHLCRKNLQGQDIYMYRGEKGFCSPECRSRQILIDERKEVE